MIHMPFRKCLTRQTQGILYKSLTTIFQISFFKTNRFKLVDRALTIKNTRKTQTPNTICTSLTFHLKVLKSRP